MMQVVVYFVTIWSTVFGQYHFAIQKNPAERVTSIAVDSSRLYFTYLDLSKDSGSNGVLKVLNVDDEEKKWEIVNFPNVPEMTTPIHVHIDECYRLWVLDNGVQNISGTQNKHRHPSLIAYDLKRNQTILSYKFPPNVIDTETFFTNLAVDIGETCKITLVYVADFNGRKLIKYDLQSRNSTLFRHHFFNPSPFSRLPDEVIYNKNHDTVSGIHGLTIAQSVLLFSPFASKHDFAISVNRLRNAAVLDYNDITLLFNRTNEISTIRFDRNLTLFYAGLKKIGCRRLVNGGDYVELDVDLGVGDGFLTDIQITGPILWYLINNENNATIGSIEISTLVKGTLCDKESPIVTKINLQETVHSTSSSTNSRIAFSAMLCVFSLALMSFTEV